MRIIEGLTEKLLEDMYLYKPMNDYFSEKQNKLVDSTILWRYMDLSKFVQILQSKSLFFSKPRYFEDPFEGSYSQKQIRYLSKTTQLSDEDIRQQIIEAREKVFINCWHSNRYESAAMWHLYLQNIKEGIAIKTTVGRLKQSFIDNVNNPFICPVSYIDYDVDPVKVGKHWLDSFLFKRKSFEHENEVRALFYVDHPQYLSHYAGLPVKTQLANLIDAVYVSPTAQKWFFDVIKIELKKYGLHNVPIIQSSLYDRLY